MTKNQSRKEGSTLQRCSSIFSQLLQLCPRVECEQAVRAHHAERHARGCASWSQFIAMLLCQLGRAHSLREICGGLASVEGKVRHLGLRDAPNDRRGPTPIDIGRGNSIRPCSGSGWRNARAWWPSGAARRFGSRTH